MYIFLCVLFDLFVSSHLTFQQAAASLNYSSDAVDATRLQIILVALPNPDV